MLNNFFCKKPYINLYEKPSFNSKISSQLLYGEKYKILLKKKNFLKIKCSYDNYIGYIKSSNDHKRFSPTHKINVLKSRIFKQPKNYINKKYNQFLSFSSEIQVLKKKNNFVMFQNNKWLNNKDICLIKKKEKNYIKILNLFLKCKYKWGGKTFNGIDCSALIQIFYKFNNKFFPRDTIDQIKIKKGGGNKNKFKKGDIIFWKGHVALCISAKKLIHAYGPKKRVIVMPIKETIQRIKKTANLKIKKIYRI